jgi:hypothetical protein
MDFSQAFTAFVGWAVISVPVSLLIGAFIGRGSHHEMPMAMPVRTTEPTA